MKNDIDRMVGCIQYLLYESFRWSFRSISSFLFVVIRHRSFLKITKKNLLRIKFFLKELVWKILSVLQREKGVQLILVSLSWDKGSELMYYCKTLDYNKSGNNEILHQVVFSHFSLRIQNHYLNAFGDEQNIFSRYFSLFVQSETMQDNLHHFSFWQARRDTYFKIHTLFEKGQLEI